MNSSHVDRFAVQRSGNGVVYTTIGTVYPPASGDVLSYTFVMNGKYDPPRALTRTCKW
jgi:hypothetical protein